MKKLFILAVAAMTMASCSMPARLVNTAAHAKNQAAQPFAAVFADLKVSPTKITYFMIPSKTVVAAGEENVVNSAVREALLANGNADVLVCMNTQIKYTTLGEIESITVTGYPATYVNFRSPSQEYYERLKPSDFKVQEEVKPAGLGGIFKKK